MVPSRPLGTILLADDSSDDCDLVREAWSEVPVGKELRCVHDGTELLEYLNREGSFSNPVGVPRPSIILLDLHMPRMSGYEALHQIKSDPRHASIPIIILTTSKAPRDIHKSASWGIHGYIQKPDTFSGYCQLLSNLQRHWEEILERPYGRGFLGGGAGNLAYC